METVEVGKEQMREMFDSLDKTNLREVVASEVAYPSLGEKCLNPDHEHAAIGCMWHDYEHEVGEMCLEEDCAKQWFFASDWSSPECRARLAQKPKRPPSLMTFLAGYNCAIQLRIRLATRDLSSPD